MMHVLLLLQVAALTLITPVYSSPTPIPARDISPKHILYVASQSLGILTVQLDTSMPSNSSLQIVNTIQGGYQPGWLSAHGDLLCSVSRTEYPDNSSTSGGIFTWHASDHLATSFPPAPGLQAINSTSSNGLGAVYCGISKDGRALAAADIDGAVVSILSLSPSGEVGPATHVFQYSLNLTTPGPGWNESQIQSNPHQSIFDPSGRCVVVPDRGADRLYIYDLGSPLFSAVNNVSLAWNITLEPGTGPRHVTFHPIDETRVFMYLVSELDNTVRVFSLRYSDTQLTNLTLVQVQSTLGPGSNRTEPHNRDLASEVALSADGKFLYASNRNAVSLDSDTLAVFAVNLNATDDNHLIYLGKNETGGKIVRHFSLSGDVDGNEFVAVANEVSNNVMVFSRDQETGFLGDVVGSLTLGGFDLSQKLGPMAVIWGS